MTAVFHSVDDGPTRRTIMRPTSAKEPSPIRSTMVNGGANEVDDESNISRFRDTACHASPLSEKFRARWIKGSKEPFRESCKP